MSNPELPPSVLVRDVVMRDGIQNLKQVLPTELKVEIIEGLADAGIRRIEATSFMNPKAVPATADADEVMRRIKRKPGVTYECLVANERGAHTGGGRRERRGAAGHLHHGRPQPREREPLRQTEPWMRWPKSLKS